MDANANVLAAVEGDAVEFIPASSARPAILLCCEHASNRLPPAWAWPEADQRLVEQHWAYDLGIADVTRQLAARLGAPAVLSRFSRLLIDPNRPLDSDTLFRDVADGEPVWLNTGLAADDARRRIDGYYEPYHRALGAMVEAFPGVHMLSLHSFTPEYEGQPRQVEVGVLFDEDEAWADVWCAGLSVHGWDTRRNEPWSGRNGLMFSVQRHASKFGRRAIELEFRQDHTTDERGAARIVDALAELILGSAEILPTR
jgi:predicted N-formylglutamate amidohydrolase